MKNSCDYGYCERAAATVHLFLQGDLAELRPMCAEHDQYGKPTTRVAVVLTSGEPVIDVRPREI